MSNTETKIIEAEQRRNEGLVKIKELKKLIDTIESEVTHENILIDRYRQQRQKEIEAEQVAY